MSMDGSSGSEKDPIQSGVEVMTMRSPRTIRKLTAQGRMASLPPSRVMAMPSVASAAS
jgi:hypothetical protein